MGYEKDSTLSLVRMEYSVTDAYNNSFKDIKKLLERALIKMYVTLVFYYVLVFKNLELQK